MEWGVPLLKKNIKDHKRTNHSAKGIYHIQDPGANLEMFTAMVLYWGIPDPWPHGPNRIPALSLIGRQGHAQARKHINKYQKGCSCILLQTYCICNTLYA